LDKAPEAFRTISEVADELKIPQHVLRFWESRFRDIKPLKRGGNRRYYRPDDVDLLRGIRHLLYGEGYTIRGVQRILRDQGPRFVQMVWQAGAPQPAHGPSDDGALDDDVAAGEEPEAEEPRVGRAGPTAGQPVLHPAPARRLSPEARHKLQAVLADLIECRRLLNAAGQS
jgi:DNA-binding transcriptional MerR regulator